MLPSGNDAAYLLSEYIGALSLKMNLFVNAHKRGQFLSEVK